MPVTVSKKGPGFKGLARDLKRLEKSEVLVGIPAQATQRKDEPINNASLLFIHSNGSQLRHIPPRPVLEPSIEANKKLIAPHLAAAAKDVLERDPEGAQHQLELAGTTAANGAKRWFTDPRNDWAPNAPTTIERKGSDKPLIDTGQLRRAITYVVRQDGAVKAKPREDDQSDRSAPSQAADNANTPSPESAPGPVEEAVEGAAESLL